MKAIPGPALRPRYALSRKHVEKLIPIRSAILSGRFNDVWRQVYTRPHREMRLSPKYPGHPARLVYAILSEVTIHEWRIAARSHRHRSASRLGSQSFAAVRLTVEYILNPLAHGAEADILAEYQGLGWASRHLFACRSAQSLQSTLFMPLGVEPA